MLIKTFVVKSYRNLLPGFFWHYFPRTKRMRKGLSLFNGSFLAMQLDLHNPFSVILYKMILRYIAYYRITVVDDLVKSTQNISLWIDCIVLQNPVSCNESYQSNKVVWSIRPTFLRAVLSDQKSWPWLRFVYWRNCVTVRKSMLCKYYFVSQKQFKWGLVSFFTFSTQSAWTVLKHKA